MSTVSSSKKFEEEFPKKIFWTSAQRFDITYSHSLSLSNRKLLIIGFFHEKIQKMNVKKPCWPTQKIGSPVLRNGTHCHIKWYQCQMGREEHWSIWGQNGAKMFNWNQNGEKKLYLGKSKYCKISIEKTLVRILNQNNASIGRTPLIK